MSDTIEIQKLDDLIENLQFFRKNYGNLPLVYSIDDEGNDYEDVIFTPTPMSMDEDLDVLDSDLDNPTHLCIN